MDHRASIVTSILPADVKQARRAIADLPPGPHPIELRADSLTAGDVATVVAATDRPLIVTVRRVADGGRFDGLEPTRRDTLLAALEAGAEWIDVEFDSPAATLADGPHADRVILSDHGLPCERETLEWRLEKMSSSRAARLKIVATAARASQIVAIRDLLRERGDNRLCAFALGEPGALTRVLAPAWGSWGTYASAAPGAETAPGQFTAAQLRDVFDAASIRESTRVVALAGRDVLAASPSPAMHNAGYRALGMDRIYVPLQTPEWSDVVTVSEALGLAGLAVTMPFKTAAADYVARRDALSTLAHASNTIVYEQGDPVGANTDGPAAVACLEGLGLVPEDDIDVLGAGGTGRSIAAALTSAGYRPRVWSRDPAATGLPGCGAHHDRIHGAADWLVNATPLRDDTLLGAGAPARRGVLEAVYAGAPTALVTRAERAGLKVADGLSLLVAQAERQFEFQTGQKPPAGLFAAVGQRHLAEIG